MRDCVIQVNLSADKKTSCVDGGRLKSNSNSTRYSVVSLVDQFAPSTSNVAGASNVHPAKYTWSPRAVELKVSIMSDCKKKRRRRVSCSRVASRKGRLVSKACIVSQPSKSLTDMS